MVVGSGGWQSEVHQWLMGGPVSSSGGWVHFCSIELKSPKNRYYNFLSIFGGWMGGTDQNMDKSIFISDVNKKLHYCSALQPPTMVVCSSGWQSGVHQWLVAMMGGSS